MRWGTVEFFADARAHRALVPVKIRLLELDIHRHVAVREQIEDGIRLAPNIGAAAVRKREVRVGCRPTH